jgi:hypothetical protein
MVKLRLHITYDYEANPAFYPTDDPHAMALNDLQNLTEGVVGIVEFLDGEGRLSYAIEPLMEGKG